jgi:hypothetical protein
VSGISPYTSWTYSIAVAKTFANTRGRGGIVLRLPIDKPPDKGDGWSWEASPDIHHEEEVLLRGLRMDAEVLPDV